MFTIAGILITISPMLFEIKLGWRYFVKGRGRLAGFTSVAAVLGIAVGLAAFILAQALADGFSNRITDKILAGNSHIVVSRRGDTAVSNWRFVQNKIRKNDNVSEVQATSYTSAVLFGKGGSGYAMLRVRDDDAPDRKRKKHNAAGLRRRVLVGKELALTAGLSKGDEAEIVAVDGDGIPRNTEVVVDGLLDTGLYEYDSTWIILDSETYAEITGADIFLPPAFGVKVKNVFLSGKTAEELRKRLGAGFRVIDWQEANRPLFEALSLERKVALAIIALIVLVAALNITTTLALLVNQRRFDIAVLRACGANTKKIASVFLIEGTVLSLAGIALGISSGLGIALLSNRLRLVSLSKKVYSLSYIPLDVDPAAVALSAMFALALCILSMIIPVLMISRIKPLESLKV